MKKTKFIPMIMLASLAAGCVTAVTANDGVSVSASVKDGFDREGSLFDSFLSKIGVKDIKTSEINTVSSDDKDCCDHSSIVSSVVNVVSHSEDLTDEAIEDNDLFEADEETVQSGNTAEEAYEDPEVISDDISYSMQTDTYDAYIEEMNEDPKDTTEILEYPEGSSEVKEEQVSEPSVIEDESFNDDKAQISDIDADAEDESAEDMGEGTNSPGSAESAQESEVHEHEWIPVTKMIHHDAVTHTEEVLLSVYDNNKSFSYEDEEGNTICNVFKHGTIDTYENDEMVSSEGADTAGTIEINNVLTGEKYTFAPGELDSYDEFVHNLFDGEVYECSGMLGPAYEFIESREIIDAEAYDEEVTEGHICEVCGETK